MTREIEGWRKEGRQKEDGRIVAEEKTVETSGRMADAVAERSASARRMGMLEVKVSGNQSICGERKRRTVLNKNIRTSIGTRGRA